VTPLAHPRSLFDPIVFSFVQCSYPEQPIQESNERATSPVGNCASTVWRRLWEAIFRSILIHLLSDMVNTRSFTRSSHPQQPQPMQPPPSAPGASNDPDLRDFLKSMAESMEVLRKQNEELNARITAAEARSSEKEREHAERREKERRDRTHREKRPVNPRQEDNESTVQGENEENRDKSRRTNGGSRRDRTQREESPRGESRREKGESKKSNGERREEEKSHRSKRHREKSHHEESRRSHQEAKMKDLEDKYAQMLR
jgi:hypothetical protein